MREFKIWIISVVVLAIGMIGFCNNKNHNTNEILSQLAQQHNLSYEMIIQLVSLLMIVSSLIVIVYITQKNEVLTVMRNSEKEK